MKTKFDSYQQAAIEHINTHSIIIASAGSGKTTTLLGKIEFILSQGTCLEEEILCLSFTNETVNQLKAKLERLGILKIHVFTFHKLAYSLLQSQNMQIIDQDYLEFILEEVLNSFMEITTIKNIFEDQKIKEILNLSRFFINNPTIFQEVIKRKWRKKEKKLILCSYILAELYLRELKAHQAMDYETMINEAKVMLPKNLNYKYIIIDEYQDISINRFQLIQKIITQTNAILTVVGDDYQSIYRFSGSKMNLFTNFQEQFPNSKIFFLQKTYRNSQELIDKSIHFIEKNKDQIKKSIISDKHLKDPIVYIPYFNKQKIITELISIYKTHKKPILILGRNNLDFQTFFPNQKITKDGYFSLDSIPIQLRFLTIHKAKGLEEEIVCIINLTNQTYGFPNKVKENRIIKYLNQEDFLFDEERRLFYVALTRTKSYCYLFFPILNPSSFILELIKK